MRIRYFFPFVKNHLKTGLLLYHLIDSMVIKKVPKKRENTLLIIRLDSLGDYLLFRNHLKHIKESRRFQDHRITLCGNQKWKEIAETFDRQWVDDFIWIDIDHFYRNYIYRLKILKRINQAAFETAIQPTYSREYFLEGVIRATDAMHRIGNSGDLSQMTAFQKRIADRYYTHLLPAKGEILFEFERNKEFNENLLKRELENGAPCLDVHAISNGFRLPEIYVALFPGAGMKFKRWSVEKFVQIVDFLWNNYRLEVVILGGKSEGNLADKIRVRSKSKNTIDLTGKTNLSEVAKVISGARLLITNDSCAVHFAASVRTETIVLLPGNFLGRFSPYPQSTFGKIHSIYPKPIMNHMNHLGTIKERYRYSTDLNVNDIPVKDVEALIQRILSGSNSRSKSNPNCQIVHFTVSAA